MTKRATTRRPARSWLAGGRVTGRISDGRFDWLEAVVLGPPALVVWALTIGVTAGIGVLDVGVGDLSLSALYLVPVAVATARGGRAAGFVVGAVAAATWTSSDALTEHGRSLAVTLVNGTMFLLLFISAALLLAALNEALARAGGLARTDALTGAANRRALDERFELERYRSFRNSTPVTLVYLDIDRFKRINDLHGHSAGDAAIRAVCRALTSVTRHGDVVARLGGDEFILLLPDIDDVEARSVADRILALRISEPSGTAVTLSLGILTCVGEPPPLEDALAAADAAMYEAKRKGGGRAAYQTHVGLAAGETLDASRLPSPTASVSEHH